MTIQRQLNRVERESVLVGDFQHVEMYARIFVTCEPDVPDLAGRLCFQQCRICSFVIEDAVRIVVSNYLVMLNEIEAVDLQTSK